MKKATISTLALVIGLFFSITELSAQLDMPAPSPSSTLKQAFGLGEVTIVYSRPGKKGRDIMGGLVPYGQLWRTGANARTKISFTDDVNMEGKALKAGEYALLTIPGEKEWTIIMSNDVNGAPNANDESKEAARFKVSSVNLPANVENFTIMMDNIKNESAEIWLMWEETAVPIKITTDVDGKVMKGIDNMMAGPSANEYYQAASYYFANGKDNAKALKWVDKALDMGYERYWVMGLKANIHKAMGDKSAAKTTAMKAIKLAEEAKNMDFVRTTKAMISELK